MTLGKFTADDLFRWLTRREDFLLLDVRNDVEFRRFQVEGPHPFEMINVPYMEFIEREEESIAKVPRGKSVRIVCAKEGSSKYVGEIMVNHGFQDVAHMEVLVVAPAGGLPVLDGEARREELGDRVRLEVEEATLGRVVSGIESAGGRVLAVQPVRQSLEDYFYREMGGEDLEGGPWEAA